MAALRAGLSVTRWHSIETLTHADFLTRRTLIFDLQNEDVSVAQATKFYSK